MIGSLPVVSGGVHFENEFLFYRSIIAYSIVPTSLVFLVAFLITATHLVVGCCLLTQHNVVAGSVVSLILFSIYGFAQVYAVYRGLEIDCGCYGPMRNETIGVASILKVGCFATASGLLVYLSSRTPSMGSTRATKAIG